MRLNLRLRSDRKDHSTHPPLEDSLYRPSFLRSLSTDLLHKLASRSAFTHINNTYGHPPINACPRRFSIPVRFREPKSLKEGSEEGPEDRPYSIQAARWDAADEQWQYKLCNDPKGNGWRAETDLAGVHEVRECDARRLHAECDARKKDEHVRWVREGSLGSFYERRKETRVWVEREKKEIVERRREVFEKRLARARAEGKGKIGYREKRRMMVLQEIPSIEPVAEDLPIEPGGEDDRRRWRELCETDSRRRSPDRSQCTRGSLQIGRNGEKWRSPSPVDRGEMRLRVVNGGAEEA